MYYKLKKLQNSKLWKMLGSIQGTILSLCSVFITIIIFLTVIMRYIFKTDLYGVEEIILVIAFWLYFIGGVNGSMEDSHIKADILDVFIKIDKLKYTLKSVSKVIESIVFIVFTKFSVDLVILNFHRMPKTPGLKIPYVITQTSIALGFIMMSLYTMYYAVLFFYRSRISEFKGEEN